MTGTAAATMMLADLDEVLRELLDRELAARGLGGVAITFDAPSRDRTAQWPSPALDLFLYDLREAPGVRDRAWRQTSVDGRAVLRRAPLRLACTYAISAWAQSVLDEHRLLSQVVSILCAHPQLPVDLLPASLLVGDPPAALGVQLAHTREEARADFWTALGNQYKLSIEYTVTVLCDPGVSVERGPAVTSEVVSLQAAGARDAVHLVGGEVRDAHGLALADAAVSVPALGLACVTDAQGRFVLRGVPAGAHAVQARASGRLASGELAVPGGGIVLTLPSEP